MYSRQIYSSDLRICSNASIVREGTEFAKASMLRGTEVENIKRCFVPFCPNTSSNSPTKHFLTVPPKTGIRNLWFAAASITLFPPLRKTIHFCQDHFQPEDVNKLKSFGRVSVMEANVFPSRFECQSQQNLVHMLNNHGGESASIPDGSNSLDALERVEIKVEPVFEEEGQELNEEAHPEVHTHFCKKCDFSAPSAKLLKAHKSIHLSAIKCSDCGYETKNRYNMKYHLMWHRGEAPLQCYHCDYKCAKMGKLRSHMMVHTKERPYKCPFCDHRTAQSSNLKKHIMTHSLLKPHCCNLCSYRGSTRAALTAHLLVHSGARRYGCPHCDYRSARTTDLKKHVMTHSDMKPLACPHCDYRCIQLGALKVHIASHKCSPPMKCPYCHFETTKIQDLKKHHHSQHCCLEMHFCSDCNFFSTSMDKLKSHFMSQHYNPTLHSLLQKDYKLI